MNITDEEDLAATALEKRIGRYYEPGDTVHFLSGRYQVVEVLPGNKGYLLKNAHTLSPFRASASFLTLASPRPKPMVFRQHLLDKLIADTKAIP